MALWQAPHLFDVDLVPPLGFPLFLMIVCLVYGFLGVEVVLLVVFVSFRSFVYLVLLVYFWILISFLCECFVESVCV